MTHLLFPASGGSWPTLRCLTAQPIASPLSKIEDEIWKAVAFGKDGELEAVLQRHPVDSRASYHSMSPSTEPAQEETTPTENDTTAGLAADHQLGDIESGLGETARPLIVDSESALREAVVANLGADIEEIRDLLANTFRELTMRQVANIPDLMPKGNQTFRMTDPCYGNYSILYIAICREHCLNARYLLRNFKMDLTFRCSLVEATPLMQASLTRRLDLVEEILKCPSMAPSQYINASDTRKYTALHYFMKGARRDDTTLLNKPPSSSPERDSGLEILKALISHGASIDALTARFQTPLHVLISLGGDGGLMGYLLESGAELNTKDDFGDSPLHTACRRGYPDLIEKLIDGGADLDSLNLYWNTPREEFYERRTLTEKQKKFAEKFFNLQKVPGKHRGGGTAPRKKIECSQRVKDICSKFPVYIRYQCTNPVPSGGGTSFSWTPTDSKVTDVLYPEQQANDAEQGGGRKRGGRMRFPHDYDTKFHKHILWAMREENKTKKSQEKLRLRITDEPGDGEQSSTERTAIHQDEIEAKFMEQGWHKWKWINFPSNNMTWIKDFIVNNFRGETNNDVDSRKWHFFQSSIKIRETNDLTSRIRRPHIMVIGGTSPSTPETLNHNDPPTEHVKTVSWRNADIFVKPGSMVSLVIPFFDIEANDNVKTVRKTPHEKLEELEQAYSPFTGMHGLQLAQTLDQTSRSTGEKESKWTLRKKEHQVIYRWSKPSNKDPELPESIPPKRRSYETRSRPKSLERNAMTEPGMEERLGQKQPNAAVAQRIRQDSSFKWLMVRQVWLWKLDDNTFITAIPSRKSVHTADNLLETIRQGDLGGFRDSNDLIKHIIFEAISFPNEFKWAGLGEHVLDIFEAEIASAADKEAKFFWEFTDPKSNPRDMNLTIERAAKSTWLVKDIRDELRLLRQLFENQLKLAQEVSETFSPTLMPGETRSSKEARKSIRENFIGESGVETLIQRVKQMDEDASTTLDGLSNIIQAMQAQASLKEAEAARFMNAIILPFTVVTVIFTPLSFLTSLFAINTSGFPHNGDGELSLSTKWFSLRMVFGELTSLVATFLLVWLAYTWQHKPKADKKPKTDARLSNMKGKR